MFGNDFYPTPQDLADRMIEALTLDHADAILEPSAGRGDLADRIREKLPYHRQSTSIDVIELDDELRHVLDGKGYHPIGHDFLTFKTFRQYDAIIMNPPFSDGDKHLIKALDLVADGGQIACLLNAETIRNPFTRSRQNLVEALDSHGATIEYLTGAFDTADRKTSVEVALVVVKVERKKTSTILENLVRADELQEKSSGPQTDIVEGDFVRGAVRRYEIEVSAGLKLIDEYNALSPLLSTDFNTEYPRPILELRINGESRGSMRNTLVSNIRMKYWKEMFQSREFSRMFTSKTQREYERQVGALVDYEFTVANIKQMQLELSQSMLGTLDDAIMALFDGFTNQYWDESSANIHYYNGWKTNKSYIVNRKVIDRCYSAFGSWDKKFRGYAVHGSIVTDIEKVFSYLDGKVYDPEPIETALRIAEATNVTRNVDFTYCTASFFKKGTVHIVFKDERLLKKFNLIGSRRKGWLPPDYGKKAYTNMTNEERAVVDEFEGEEAYADTVKQIDFYESRTSLGLGSGF